MKEAGPGTKFLRVIGAAVLAGAVLFGVVRGWQWHQRSVHCAAVVADTSRFVHINADHLLASADSEVLVLPSERKVSPASAAQTEAHIERLRKRAAALEQYRAALRPESALPDRALLDPEDRSVVDELYEGPDAEACADLWR